jgi:hypothetical protein
MLERVRSMQAAVLKLVEVCKPPCLVAPVRRTIRVRSPRASFGLEMIISTENDVLSFQNVLK